VVGDPTGAGELLAGVTEGLAVRDEPGDRVGEGEVLVGVSVGVLDEGVTTGWVEPAGAGAGTGRTRK
jgi:hypothetical protein